MTEAIEAVEDKPAKKYKHMLAPRVLPSTGVERPGERDDPVLGWPGGLLDQLDEWPTTPLRTKVVVALIDQRRAVLAGQEVPVPELAEPDLDDGDDEPDELEELDPDLLHTQTGGRLPRGAEGEEE